jgi:ABC-2 type transport system ATP-binding protein
VSFTGAVKTFGDVRAVAGVDLDIGRGETVALLGRNGAGKSTAISLLLGLDEPDEGSVALFGRPPEESVHAGRVGAVAVLTAWLLVFGSYAVVSYRRSARTV